MGYGPNTRNHESLAELLVGFFHYFAYNFDYHEACPFPPRLMGIPATTSSSLMLNRYLEHFYLLPPLVCLFCKAAALILLRPDVVLCFWGAGFQSFS
jgi:hypothetical protein